MPMIVGAHLQATVYAIAEKVCSSVDIDDAVTHSVGCGYYLLEEDIQVALMTGLVAIGVLRLRRCTSHTRPSTFSSLWPSPFLSPL